MPDADNPVPTDTGQDYRPDRRDAPSPEERAEQAREERAEARRIAEEQRAEERRAAKQAAADERRRQRQEESDKRAEAKRDAAERRAATKQSVKQARDEAKRKAKAARDIDREVDSVRRRQEREDKQEEAKRKREEKKNPPQNPKDPVTLKTIGRQVGNIVVAGTKEIVSDGSGRSGRRATKAYRQANRQYNSEARRIRSQVKSPSQFSSLTMFGMDKTPVRSRHEGMNQFGDTSNTLSGFSTMLLGAKVESRHVEGVGQRMVRNDYNNNPQESHLSRFSKKIMGL